MASQPLKRLSKHPLVHKTLAWFGAIYIRLVLVTSRLHLHVPETAQPFFSGESNGIFALWHSRVMLIQSNLPTNRTMYAMVSEHRDGRMIGDILGYFGVVPVHGSTSKSGAKALKNLVRVYHSGHHVCITPDGPRGPAEHVSEGIAQLAMLTQAPIICVSYAASRVKYLRSWDKFMLALPFSHIHFVAAAPLIYTAHNQDKHLQREQVRTGIESTLKEVTHRADVLAGLI